MTKATSAPPVTRVDRFGVVMLLAFAFFVASVPARNADLFALLGPSRTGGWSGAWLYEFLLVTVYKFAPEWGVVALKAGVQTTFVGIGVRAFWQRGISLRLALLGGMLLALSLLPWAAVDAFSFKLLFVAMLLVVLPRRPWVAVGVTLVWANLADVAILAPLLVLAFGWDQRPRSWWLLLATTVAAFVSPEPLRALRVPGLLADVPAVFQPEGLAALSSPFTRTFWNRSAGYEAFLGVFVGAYVVPLLASIGWRRYVPRGLFVGWLVCAGLGVVHWKFVPLVVLTGSLLCASILEARPSVSAAGGRVRWERVTAGLTVLGGLLLPLVAWVGWLQAPPYAARALTLEPEPSLQAVAQLIATHEQATLFPLSPTAADHLAFTTHHRLVYTSRSNNATLRDAATVAQALTELDRPWNDAARAILRQTGTTHLVLFHTDKQRFSVALAKVLAQPKEFPILIWRGRAIVVGWRDPHAAPSPQSPTHDWTALADPAWQTPAPENGPERLRPERWWRDALTLRPAPRTADRDEATVALILFEHQRLQRAQANPMVYEAHMIAGLVGAGTTPGQIPLRLEMTLARYFADLNTGRPSSAGGAVGVIYFGLMQQLTQDGSVPVLLRGVRAARRAVVANPRDANAYYALGECYLRLHHFTADRQWGKALAPLERVRLAQVAYACRQALLLDPQLVAAHRTLVQVYLEQRYFDAALLHLEEVVRVTRMLGAQPDESATVFAARLKALEDQLERLQKQVAQGEAGLADMQGARPYDRAATAFNNGLPHQALTILLGSDIAAFGKDGLQLEANLLISLGRAHDAADWLTPDLQEMLGPATFHSLRWQALAVIGDYKEARQQMENLFDLAETPGLPTRVAVGQLAGLLFADACHTGLNHMTALIRERNRYLWRLQATSLLDTLGRQADVYTQLAWLTLEQGDYARAEDYAQQAIRVAGTQPFFGRSVAEALLPLSRPTSSPSKSSGKLGE